MIVTSWSDFNPGIDEMRKRQRFSCFEVGENMQAAKRLGSMVHQGIIEVTGGDFPWSTYKLHTKRTTSRRRHSLIRFKDNSILLEAV